MAGHSKWANIKHRKARQDSKRGKLFTTLIRELTVAARGGANPADNPRLRRAMDRGLSANMVRDTINRAIERGAGGGEADNLIEIRYEGYGPNGIAVLVDTMTDNRNRTVAEVRHTFSKNGGNLGTDGSVAYLFDRYGVIEFVFDNDKMTEQAIDVAITEGAEDVAENAAEDVKELRIIIAPDSLENLLQCYQAIDCIPKNSELIMHPNHLVPLENEIDMDKLMILVTALEDLDDVQNVFHNADF